MASGMQTVIGRVAVGCPAATLATFHSFSPGYRDLLALHEPIDLTIMFRAAAAPEPGTDLWPMLKERAGAVPAGLSVPSLIVSSVEQLKMSTSLGLERIDFPDARTLCDTCSFWIREIGFEW